MLKGAAVGFRHSGDTSGSRDSCHRLRMIGECESGKPSPAEAQRSRQSYVRFAWRIGLGFQLGRGSGSTIARHEQAISVEGVILKPDPIIINLGLALGEGDSLGDDRYQRWIAPTGGTSRRSGAEP